MLSFKCSESHRRCECVFDLNGLLLIFFPLNIWSAQMLLCSCFLWRLVICHSLCYLIYQISSRVWFHPPHHHGHVLKCIGDAWQVLSQGWKWHWWDQTVTRHLLERRGFLCLNKSVKRGGMGCHLGRLCHKWRSHLLILSLYTLHASFVFLTHSHARLFLSAVRPSCLNVLVALTAVGEAFPSPLSFASCTSAMEQEWDFFWLTE